MALVIDFYDFLFPVVVFGEQVRNSDDSMTVGIRGAVFELSY